MDLLALDLVGSQMSLHFFFTNIDSVGETQALASLSGPIEVRLALENSSRASFEVMLRPLSNVPGTESKALASIVRNVLTPSLILTVNPRSLVQLVVQSLSPTHGGKFGLGMVAAMINAGTLALLNAGSVPMRGVICAVSVGKRSNLPRKESSTQILDPNELESNSPTLEGKGCFAFLFASDLSSSSSASRSGKTPPNEVVYSSWQSTTLFSESEFINAREQARFGAEQLWVRMKESVVQSNAPKQSLWKTKDARKTDIALDLASESEESGESDDDKMKI